MIILLCVLVTQAVVSAAATDLPTVNTTIRQPKTVLPWRYRPGVPERPDLPFAIRDPAQIDQLDRFAPHKVWMESTLDSSWNEQSEKTSNGAEHHSILVEIRSRKTLNVESPNTKCQCHSDRIASSQGMVAPVAVSRKCTQCCRSCRHLCNKPQTKTKCGCPR